MTLPISKEILQSIETLSATELAWLSGYCWSESQQNQTINKETTIINHSDNQIIQVPKNITILSASQTGNARKVAEQLLIQLEKNNLNVRLIAIGDYKTKSIANEDIVLLVSSTQGEGEPPEEAIVFHKFIFGKKAPNLNQLQFAVLGLGDTSYPNFCQAAKEFDQQFEKLGAKRLLDRVDCDLDYDILAKTWIENISTLITEEVKESSINTNENLPSAHTSNQAIQIYTKENPYTATLAIRQKITSDTALKDVEHIEIDLQNSNIHYQPGDALGVYYKNNIQLVNEILQHTQIDENTHIELADGKTTNIKDALMSHFDITQNSTAFIKSLAQITQNQTLLDLIQDPISLNKYVAETPPIGVLKTYPIILSATQLIGLFRPLTPRLYSIASSQAEVGEEVHLTVGVVRYKHQEKTYLGGASGYLGELLQEGDEIQVYIEENKNFKLPINTNTNIIMIGAGTGIAPFRAFMQERENQQATGENWLIFGNQRLKNDFLYQTEWLQYRKNGLLNHYDFAWSRDSETKVYVQDKLIINAAKIWQWLEKGSYLYVCGDATKMAKDIEQTLLTIVQEQGGLSVEDADDYLCELREQKRYQRDVY